MDPRARAATVPRAMSPPVRPDPRPLPSGTRLDAHLHVWPSPEDHTYSSGKEPPAALARNANPEALLERCAAANVHGALIVQPINLGFDHAYVADAIRRHPGRFVGCCLADPTVGGGGMDALAHLLVPEGPFRAVRFNPGLWPEGERMTNPVGRDMFRLAGERGAPVGFMCFHGLHLHVEDIKDLCAEFSNTPVLIDHFGFVKGADDPNWAALLSLAEFPNVSVKASAHFSSRARGRRTRLALSQHGDAAATDGGRVRGGTRGVGERFSVRDGGVRVRTGGGDCRELRRGVIAGGDRGGDGRDAREDVSRGMVLRRR